VTLTSFLRQRGIHILIALLLFATVFASCGGPEQKKAPKSTVLTMLANTGGGYTRNFNPYSSSVISGTQGLMYETLLQYNRLDGTVKPWLASSYEMTSDAQSLTFHLTSGVQWSDGQPFSSDDVLFTLNLIKDNGSIDGSGIGQYLKDVSAPDSSTIKVTLSQPFFPILWYLGGQTYILPKHVWSNVKDDPAKFDDPDPVGTGPLKLKSFTPQLVVLEKNPKFRQASKVVVTELRIPAFDSNTSAELALQKGEIDWTNLYIPNIQKTYIDLDKKHNHYWFPASDIVMLFVNLTRPPFDKLEVRQAISYAIDRDQLNTVGESGYEPPASPTALVPTHFKDYQDPQYTSLKFTQDAKKATSLLESLGYTRGGDGIYADKSGKKLDFKLNVVSGYTDWITNCQLMQQQLKAVGINVTVNTVDFDTYYDALQKGDYDLAMLWTNPGPTPYYILDGLLRSSNSAPVGEAAPSNFQRWNDPKTDELLDQYASTSDPALQKQAIQGLQKIMVEQLPSIPLLVEPYWYQYSTKKFVGWPDEKNPYAAPGTAVYPDIEYVLVNLRASDE
jgi:peptide/nickel transport system substrate-binding protein